MKSRVSEYGLTNIDNYLDFIKMMRTASDAIKAHWKTLPASTQRAARIDTGAEGVIPYEFMDCKAYGALVAYRRGCAFDQASADYIFVRIHPYPTRSRDLEGLTDARHEKERIISKHEVIFRQATKFESVELSWVVLWNKVPRPNLISKSVNGVCGAQRSSNG